MSSEQPIKAVPTNIITGFLGAGKTSAILKLMQHKPAYERWAILVNAVSYTHLTLPTMRLV